MCVHVKDPIYICRKGVGLTARGMETGKHCAQEKQKAKKKLGSAVLWLLAFPGEKAARISRAFALGQESYLIPD